MRLYSITFVSQIYREVEDPNTHQLVYHSATAMAGPLHGVGLNEPYKPLDAIDLKRYAARKNETTYCYDFPLVTCLQLLLFFLSLIMECLNRLIHISNTVSAGI
jgi:hypothetical protein